MPLFTFGGLGLGLKNFVLFTLLLGGAVVIVLAVAMYYYYYYYSTRYVDII